ncbi:pyruvate kinase, partial [Bacteroidota bacterium]
MTIDQDTIENLIQKLLHIVEDAVNTEEKYHADLELVHPEFRKSARNLLHYLAVRQHDMRDINQTLGMLGVTRMINAEANVMPVLRSILRILYKFAEGKKLKIKDKSKKFIDAIESFDKNTEDLLGPVRDDRHTRIMVTLPTEAAYNYDIVVQLIRSGANSLRINCAHDDEKVWTRMIDNIHKAREETGLDCRINMDLSGPKLRSG